MHTVATAIDLCSGAGGATLGLEMAGIRVIAAVDTDRLSRETYRANHGEVTVFNDDLLSLDPREFLSRLELQPGDLDILTACVPCQTYSTLGAKHRRPDDPRNNLVDRVGDFVKALAPRVVIMENVPPLRSQPRFLELMKRLHEYGYGVWWDVVDAASFGVPQRRRRLLLLAMRGVPDEQVPPIFPGHPALAGHCASATVRTAFADLGEGSLNDRLHTPRVNYPNQVARRIAAVPKDGGSRSDLPPELRLRCHDQLRGGVRSGAGNVYGRMRWDTPAPTLTTRCVTPACGRFLHPEEDRAITLREAACLQTFPVDYAFAGGTMAVQAQIGNAVPPKLASAIGLVVLDALRRQGDGLKSLSAVA